MQIIPNYPPVWTLIAVALVVLIDWLIPGFAMCFQSKWLGMIGVIVGLALIIWSVTWFMRRKTPIHPHETPKNLIVEGPYRISRNPIYLGMLTICVGVVIYIGNPLGFLPTIWLFWILHSRFVMPEEARLIEEFGDDAKHYIKKTRRW